MSSAVDERAPLMRMLRVAAAVIGLIAATAMNAWSVTALVLADPPRPWSRIVALVVYVATTIACAVLVVRGKRRGHAELEPVTERGDDLTVAVLRSPTRLFDPHDVALERIRVEADRLDHDTVVDARRAVGLAHDERRESRVVPRLRAQRLREASLHFEREPLTELDRGDVGHDAQSLRHFR